MLFDVKKGYLKMECFHPEASAVSAVVLHLQEILGEDMDCAVHGLSQNSWEEAGDAGSLPHRVRPETQSPAEVF